MESRPCSQCPHERCGACPCVCSPGEHDKPCAVTMSDRCPTCREAIGQAKFWQDEYYKLRNRQHDEPAIDSHLDGEDFVAEGDGVEMVVSYRDEGVTLTMANVDIDDGRSLRLSWTDAEALSAWLARTVAHG